MLKPLRKYYWIEGNGQAERSIQSAKTLIRCVAAEEDIPKYAWPSILQQVTFMHNATVNTSTKYTPYELMYGTKPKLPSTKCSPEIYPPVTGDLDGYVEETQYNIESKWEKAAHVIDAGDTQMTTDVKGQGSIYRYTL